jgi:hypothetical protein
MMTSKSERLDDAKELYGQAANCYKVSSNWEKALECYLKCIECEIEEGDQASFYLEACHCAKKLNT